jgi:hypothetical protein
VSWQRRMELLLSEKGDIMEAIACAILALTGAVTSFHSDYMGNKASACASNVGSICFFIAAVLHLLR